MEELKREEIYEYVKKQYGTVPEYLWKESLESAVLRHPNGKWYAVLMQVEKSRLGLEGDTKVDIIDVECDPDMVGLRVAARGARLLGVDAVAGIGGQQGVDDGVLAGVVDLGDEVVDLFLRDAHGLDVERGAVDDGASGARGPDGHVQHGVQGGRHGLCEERRGRGTRGARRAMAAQRRHFPMLWRPPPGAAARP